MGGGKGGNARNEEESGGRRMSFCRRQEAPSGPDGSGERKSGHVRSRPLSSVVLLHSLTLPPFLPSLLPHALSLPSTPIPAQCPPRMHTKSWKRLAKAPMASSTKPRTDTATHLIPVPPILRLCSRQSIVNLQLCAHHFFTQLIAKRLQGGPLP